MSQCPHCGHLHVFPIERDECIERGRIRHARRAVVIVVLAIAAFCFAIEAHHAHRIYGNWRCAFHPCERPTHEVP